MKMKSFSVFMLALAVLLCSCGHNSSDKNTPIETDTAYVVMEEDEELGLSHFSDTLSDGKYHQMILEAIANGDKQTFAKMVSYPLYRPYPVPDIESEEQMIRYFDTLFDKQFCRRIAELDSNSWDNVGWRGSMILHGEIWDTWPRIHVNYSSPLEQRYADYLRKKDMSRLNPSLRGNWEPYCCYQLDGSKYSDFDYSFARVDVSTDPNAEEESDYRVAVFKKGAKASDIPEIVLFGEENVEGSMHIETLYFKSIEYTIIIDPKNIEDGKSYFTIYHDETHQCVPCKKCMQPFQ